jgi:hypothetical protein
MAGNTACLFMNIRLYFVVANWLLAIYHQLSV